MNQDLGVEQQGLGMAFMNRFSELTRGDSALDSIVDNLNHILNAREGYGWVVRDYGIGKYAVETNSLGAAKTLMEEILKDILAFEPRLKNPVLTTQGRDSDMWLHMSLTCDMNGHKQSFNVRFHQIYGKIEVESSHDE